MYRRAFDGLGGCWSRAFSQAKPRCDFCAQRPPSPSQSSAAKYSHSQNPISAISSTIAEVMRASMEEGRSLLLCKVRAEKGADLGDAVGPGRRIAAGRGAALGRRIHVD